MTKKRPWYTHLFVQILAAIAIGVLVGIFFPQTGVALKPLGNAFIQLIRMMIAPVIFCTVAYGISSMSDMSKVARIGTRALIYFEVVSTIALGVGLLVGQLVQPGKGFNIDPSTLDTKLISGYVTKAQEDGVVAHLLAIIPTTFVDAFAKGDLLQVLLLAILTGVAISRMGTAGEKISEAIDTVGQVLFRIIGMIVKVAPLGAFGAMAFTIGAYGAGSLWNLLQLILTFYLATIVFVLVILGIIARFAGFSILKFIGYIRDELLIVLGTSSSETVLPRMLQKMEAIGASRAVVALVIPTGYSFNLAGTSIYMTLATLFLAQATNTHLGWEQEATILLVAMLTSKGSAGVAGAGFVTLAGTLSIVPDIPIQSLAIIIGVDSFMSTCRALCNLIGNGVATVVVSRWEGDLDRNALQRVMRHPLVVGEEASIEADVA